MKFKLFLTLFLCSTILFSQEDKFKFHSVSVMPTGVYFDSEIGGLGASFDINFSQNKNLHKFCA